MDTLFTTAIIITLGLLYLAHSIGVALILTFRGKDRPKWPDMFGTWKDYASVPLISFLPLVAFLVWARGAVWAGRK